MMTLRTLLEKSSDADLLREMIGFTTQRLMELEIEGLTGAAYGERSPERIAHHGGAAHPQAAERQLFPDLSGTRRLAEKGLGGGGARGLLARRLDPLGRRSRQGDGHDRHLQEPGQPVVRRNRRSVDR